MHFVHKCDCGAVISECSCPDLNNNKHVTTIKRGCAKCHGTTVSFGYSRPDNWILTDINGVTTKLSKIDMEYMVCIFNDHYHGED